MGNELEEAERFQKLFVAPVVSAVEAKLQAHMDKVEATLTGLVVQVNVNTADITKLKGNQAKALIGFGVFASFGTVLLSSAWTWIKNRLHLG